MTTWQIWLMQTVISHHPGERRGRIVENILDALRKQIDRNRELVEIYKTIPTGGFGKMMIERDIKLAEDAIAEQDTVQMIRLYGVLKGNQ